MVSPRRNRDRRRARNTPYRDPQPIILICCEGKNTEPQYLNGLVREYRNPRVKIKIAPEHGVPKTLVDIAKKYKNEAEQIAIKENDENLRYDSVWCVFDVDDHPNIHDAQQMAHDNDIFLSISNPCFELWLLLHFRENPGMQHRDKLSKMLKKHIKDYEKDIDFKKYSNGYSDVVIRAKKMDEAAESQGEPGRNPTTGVYKLTELICGRY